jgi:hypothetical protein
MVDDPAFLSSEIWSNIAQYLHAIFLYLVFIIVFAFTMLLAHAIIPSLLATKHIRPEVQRLRPLMYLFSLIPLGLAGFFIFRATETARIIEKFYMRWWI